MIKTIDNFFKWLKSAEFVSDLFIRFVVVIIVGGISLLLWFITVPILLWYFYKKFGNKRIRGCKCSNCGEINSCEDKFCIYCGSPLHGSHQNNFHSTQTSTSECKCSQCDTVNECDAKFCINCGSKLENIQLYNTIMNSIDGVAIALMAKIAKADGKISQEEASYLTHVFDLFCEKRNDCSQSRKIYKQILENEKNNLNNIDELCTLISSFNVPKDFQVDIIRIFVELAYIDGEYDINEENIIVKIVHNLKLDFAMYQNIKQEFEPKQESNSSFNGRLTLEECYEVLESKPSDSIEIIKKNYRRLVKQYHYDSIVSKDLPEDMIKFAEEKSKMINEAYNKIKKIEVEGNE